MKNLYQIQKGIMKKTKIFIEKKLNFNKLNKKIIYKVH